MSQKQSPAEVAVDMLEAVYNRYSKVVDSKHLSDMRSLESVDEPYYALSALLAGLYMKGVRVPKEYAEKIWPIVDPEDVEVFDMYLGPRPKA